MEAVKNNTACLSTPKIVEACFILNLPQCIRIDHLNLKNSQAHSELFNLQPPDSFYTKKEPITESNSKFQI